MNKVRSSRASYSSLHTISVECSLEDLTHWSTDPDLTEGIRVSVQQTFHQSSRPLDLRLEI